MSHGGAAVSAERQPPLHQQRLHTQELWPLAVRQRVGVHLLHMGRGAVGDWCAPSQGLYAGAEASTACQVSSSRCL